MQLFFIADAHLGHRAIWKYRDGINSCDENTQFIISSWEKIVPRKRSTVICLGDIAFTEETLRLVKRLPGIKRFWAGNHDISSPNLEREVYASIHGITSWKGHWLSHAPIHPAELYDRRCIHGHVHEKTITRDGVADPRYANVSVDALMGHFGKPIISLEELREYFIALEEGRVQLLPHKDFSKPWKA